MVPNNDFIKIKFESQWNISNLENEIRNCPSYDIYPLFIKYIKENMKILESGCGLGKWVFYFHRLGYNIIGLDWSQNTVDFIKSYDKNINIQKGDARSSDFKDKEFDLVLSLGTVEHAIEGPEKALHDAFRILKENGMLIITVPIMSRSRRVLNSLKNLIRSAKAIYVGQYAGLSKIKKSNLNGLFMNIYYENNRYNFFEYQFPISIFKSYIEKAGFHIVEIFPSFYSDGLYQDLGSLVGRWNYEKGVYEKNSVGKMIFKLFPKTFPHMICCVAKK
jgi:SAM-dependent methyltransferase